MPIKLSSSKQVDALVDDLASADAVRRDAAVARLSIIGGRAAERLTAVAADDSAPTSARVAALRALEAIAAPSTLDVILRLCDADDERLAVAGIEAARPFLTGDRGVEVTDRLAAVAMSRARAETVRIAAVHALGDLRPTTISPLIASLRRDSDGAIADAATRSEATLVAAINPEQTLRDAAGGMLPDAAAALGRALAQAARELPIAALKQIIDRVREREGAEPATSRASWTAVRGAAHLVLARRRSRAALYDLREAVEAAKGPLPVEFLAALTAIGDASCLEAVAAAYARARTAKAPAWWRGHLADAFRSIAAREGVTPRHATIKRIEKKYGDALRGLFPSPWSPTGRLIP